MSVIGGSIAITELYHRKARPDYQRRTTPIYPALPEAFVISKISVKNNVLLVDDHELVRLGLRLTIQCHTNVDRVLEASSGEESIELLRKEDGHIDIVIMDYNLPGLDGLITSMRILQLQKDIKIIILTGVTPRPMPRVVMQAGIRGYMTKISAADEILEAIDSLNSDDIYLSKDVAKQMAKDITNASESESPLNDLSERELQVSLLLMKGHTQSAVGDLLLLNDKTVGTYKRRSFEKLQISSLVDLMDIGKQFGIN